MPILYRYTDQKGLDGILRIMQLRPSTAKSHPKDVRYGDGQYLTDVAPGTKSAAQLSRLLFGHPFMGRRCTHYVAIEVGGLVVKQGRAGVYVIPNDQPLDLNGRLVSSGEN